MMTLAGLTLQRGDLRLLENANVSLHSGWKVGLTGANGAGKSSLFKLLLGELTPDAGELQMSGYDRIAYMAQEVRSLQLAAIDYVLEGHHELKQVELDLVAAEQAGDNQRLAELYGQYDLLHGYSKKAEAEQLLAGLGFPQAVFNNPVDSFSGGWRIRLNLARTLFMPSDLMLLDEPTNHLDLDATLWLEGWLRSYQGTLVLISHDRDFLDNVVDHLLHVENKQLNLYKGGYSAFERQRAERLAQQQSMFVKQQREVAHMEDFVRRFKAKATKAKQAQSRIKALERMERIAPAHVDSPFHFVFPEASQFSDPLLVMRKADLGYPAKPVLSGVGFTLHPGQRIGLLGPNGAGKSTLIKTLVGDLPPITGQRTQGEHLYIGYFAQHQLEALDVNATPLLHLQRLSPDVREQELRNFLGGFGFQGDEVLALVKRFSGGEKARLALAMIAWKKPNLLLLDEPTNHLDLEMRHALTLALQGFEGAVIVVSHDRHLLNNTVDEYWLVADGKVDNFDGDLEDYANWLKSRQQALRRIEKAEQPQDETTAPVVSKKLDRKEAVRLRELLRPLKKAIEQLEQQTEKIQAQLKVIETTLADVDIYSDSQRKDELQQLLKDQGRLEQELDELEMQWLESSEALEHHTAELGL
ncbi:MAG TPA: ATP-binding cassette domain-containing protein [Marinospirillum sp.]|uniref:ATP-binding cassette domain-containing protein n=1 Tax=Marinospirillum sp. TaxID=2183934 RepID=UPI002B46E8B9|nr:ATP-binding cassette domain-containing protein [Marinospirillum sp.]HKM14492.1 ATP-binding cassette domain-containing protein [Marinospirillum sp.]